MSEEHFKSKTILQKFEEKVDKLLSNIKLPSKNINLAKWILLTVADDIILITSSEKISPSLISMMADSHKYALKALFGKIKRELVDGKSINLQKTISGSIYERSIDAIRSAHDYARGEHICFGAHVDYFYLEGDENLIQTKTGKYWKNLAYSFLEIFDLEDSSQVQLLTLMVTYATNPKSFPDHQLLCQLSKQDKCGFIFSEYNKKALSEFENNHPVPPTIIPEEWMFPWGSPIVSSRLLWALTLRCCLHLMIVRSTASEYKIAGGGLENIIFVSDKNLLVNELSDYTGYDRPIVHDFIRHMTYGYKTQNPDLALQPLIPLNNGSLVATSAILLLSSRQDRNQLSLHSRIDKRSFDQKSSIFETNMTSEIATAISISSFSHINNRHIPGARQAGDLDMCIIDKANFTILICELRWMIQPGDPQEIVHRTKSCIEKIGKIKTKVEAANRQKDSLVREFVPNIKNTSTWTIRGIIVIDGYGGIESNEPEFPIMPKEIFMRSIKEFSDLNRFHTWAKSLEWLPQEGIHYEKEERIRSFGKTIIHSPGFSLTDNSREYSAYLIESARNFGQQDNISSQP